MTEEIIKGNEKAPFNMALNTLERLGEILTQIRKASTDPFFPLADKQNMKVYLARQFFLQASPLLKKDVVNNYADKWLKLKPKSLPLMKVSTNGRYEKTNQHKVIFDYDLDDSLDKFVLDIQRELQEEGYFMPPRKDLRRAVAEF